MNNTLKCHVVELLLQNPQGIRFEDFSGAFHQLHGYHPRIALQGYQTLKELVADMKNVMVGKEKNSQKQFMKIANGFRLDRGLEGEKGNELETSEGEMENLRDEVQVGGETSVCDSDPSLDSDFSTWSSQSSTQSLTRTNSASSLYCTCRSDPNHVKEPTKHVPDLPAASNLIQGVLKPFPCGIKVCKLKRLLRKKCGFDLETFRSQQGYQDVLSCLKNIPELSLLNMNRHRNCLVRLQPRSFGSDLSLDSDFSGCSSHSKPHGLTKTHSGTSSCIPSLDTSLSAGHTNAEPEKPMATNSAISLPSTSVSVPNHVKEPTNQSLALPEVLALVNDLLTKYKDGLRIKKIQEFLMATNSIDLEKFSIIQGHKDSLEFLQRHMHHLSYRKRNQRLNCLVKFGEKAKKKKPQTHPQNGTTKKNPCVASVPPLMNAPVSQSTKPLEPVYSESGVGSVSKSSVTPHDFSASKSQSQRLPFQPPSISQQVKNTIHSSMRIPLTSFHEVRSASLAKPNNSCQAVSNGPPQKPSVCQFGGPPLVEEVPCQLDRQPSSKSNVTKDKPSKDQDDLKLQVAHILAMHPEGMSLFQFRAAYSATYQRHFPMDNTASAKQRLQEMPDVVCMKNYGVQTRLLSVSSAMSSLKSDQPVSATVEKAPVVPGLSQPRTVSLTQENSEKLEGSDSKVDYPFLDSSLHQVTKPRAPVQKNVKKNPKLVGAPVIPQSPVVCRTYAQVTASCKPLKPNSLHLKPTHLNSPCISANSASVPSHPNDPCNFANCDSVPSTSHPASYNFGTWAQPVSYPFVPFVSQMPEISPVKPTYIQVSRYPSRIQFQNPTVQRSPFAQPPNVLPIRYDPTIYFTQSTEQWSNIHTLPQVDAYSPVQTSPNVLQLAQSPTSSTGRHPVSPSSRNMSQTVQQLECYNHTQQDGLQHCSVVTKKSFTVTSLDTQPKSPASAYQRQYVDWNSLASTTNTVPFISHGAWSTSQSFQPLETFSSSKRNPNALLLEPPVFLDQQQSVSASATITTSAYSPPSLVDATVSPYYNHLSLSRNCNNSAGQFSESRASIHQQQYTSLNTSVITSSGKQEDSSPCPQDLTIRPSRQLSITPLSVCTDNEPPAQANPVVSFSKHADDHRVSLPKNQTSYSPPNSPLKKPDRCVIL